MTTPFTFKPVQKTKNPESSFTFKPVKESKKEESEQRTLKEVPKQFVKGVGSGFLGTYGDVLDFLGVQSKEVLPGEQTQYQMEARATPEQLAYLTDSDEPLPRYSRLPSSEQVSQFTEELGGPGKPNTVEGKYAERAGRLLGGGLSTGSTALKAPLLAAGVGQALEEAGAPPWAQAAGEIITFAKTAKSKRALTAKSPEIQNKINDLRKHGFSEQDLTLAKNSLEDRGFWKKISKHTEGAENKFKSVYETSEKKINDIMNKGFPGLEKGLSNVRKDSSELYSALDDVSKNVVIKNPESFTNEAQKSISQLKKSLANTPQEKQVINLLEEAIQASVEERTADHYINFYQGMNQIGNWSSPKQREYVFKTVKDSIKKTFNDQGPEGKKLADLFEKSNESWKKFRQAEDVTNILEKASTEEGMNFSKLSKLLENPNNFDTISEAIGKESANNMKLISNVSKSIADLEKTMKGGVVKEALGAGKLWTLAKSLVTLDFTGLKGILGAEIGGRLATNLLTKPEYQNIHLKMLNSVKDKKYDKLRILSSTMQNKIEKDLESNQK